MSEDFMADPFPQDQVSPYQNFCQYHARRHYPPLHCRYCGKDLPDKRRWYCTGQQGECGVNWALRYANPGSVRDILIRLRGYKCAACSAEGHPLGLFLYGYHPPPNNPDTMMLVCNSCRRAIRTILSGTHH